MDNATINSIKINELENEIIEKQETKKKYNVKTERLRHFAILNTILAAASHFLAFFIHPSLLVVALLLILFGVGPEGFILFHREDKEAKFDKEIEECKQEIEKLEEILKSELNCSKEYMEPLKNLIKDCKKNKINNFQKSDKQNRKEMKNK